LSAVELFLLALAVYVYEYRTIAAANIVVTAVILLLLAKKYSEKVRVIMHVYFAIVTFSSFFLLSSHVLHSIYNIEGLRARAQVLIGIRSLPPEMMVAGAEPMPLWALASVFVFMLALVLVTTALWIYDIKKKQMVWDYSGISRSQKYLTWFLIFYALTYIHAFFFGVYIAMVSDIPFTIWLMYGLYNCPVNLLFVAILAPLVPRVNKPLYIVICIMAIVGAFFNWMIGLSVNLDALSVLPVGIYGLLMLWKSTRKNEQYDLNAMRLSMTGASGAKDIARRRGEPLSQSDER